LIDSILTLTSAYTIAYLLCYMSKGWLLPYPSPFCKCLVVLLCTFSDVWARTVQCSTTEACLSDQFG